MKCVVFHSSLQLDTGKSFQAKMRFDTDVELTYFHHGGILNYMIRKMSENWRGTTASSGRATRNAHIIHPLDTRFVPSVFLFLF